MFIDFRERGRERKREERETLMGERNIKQLPLIGAPTGPDLTTQAGVLTRDQTHHLSMYRAILQPAEPPSQSTCIYPVIMQIPALSIAFMSFPPSFFLFFHIFVF